MGENARGEEGDGGDTERQRMERRETEEGSRAMEETKREGSNTGRWWRGAHSERHIETRRKKTQREAAWQQAADEKSSHSHTSSGAEKQRSHRHCHTHIEGQKRQKRH